MLRVHWAWAVLADGFYVYLVMYGIRSGYGIILPSMSESLHLTVVEAGVIAGIFSPAYVVSALILGVVTDARGYRAIMTLFSVPMAAGAFLMAFVGDAAGGMICQALIGVGAGIGFVPMSSLIMKWFGEKQRGFALGVAQVASNAGPAVMAVALPGLVGIYGWQAGWLLMGLLGASLTFTNWFLIRDSPEAMHLAPWGESGGVRPPRRSVLSMPFVKKVLHAKRFWLVGLSYLCMTYAATVPLTFLVTYATQSGMSYASAGLLLVTLSVAGIGGSLLVGPLSDRISRKITIAISEMIMSASLGGLFLTGSGLPAYISSAAFGFSTGGIFALYAACAVDFFPKEVAGSILGLWTLFIGVSGTLSPIVSGFVAGVTGGFASAFLIACVAAVCAAVLIVPAGAVREKYAMGET